MTVSSTANRIDYLGTGTVGPFSFSFRIQQATDLTLTKTTDTGIETTLVYLTDYTVSGVGVRAGGSVTLIAVLPTGYSLTIRRVVPLTQLTNLRNQGRYFPSDVEDTFDRGTFADQQLSEVDSRQLSLPVSSDPAVVSALFPTPQANRAIFWNANETALEARLLDNSNNVALPGNSRTVSTLTGLLANNLGKIYNVLDYGAIGNGIEDDTASIRNCFAAASTDSCRVVIPEGTYRVNELLANAVFQIGVPLIITGDGFDKSIILVAATVPATTDVFHLRNLTGTDTLRGGSWTGFSVMPESGTPARHGLNIDYNDGSIAYCAWNYLQIGHFGGKSIQTSGPAVLTAGKEFYLSEFNGVVIGGGVQFDNISDSIQWNGGVITGANGFVLDQYYGATDTAHGFKMEGTNITCLNGVTVLSGNCAQFIALDSESSLGISGQTNSCLIDLQGRPGQPLVNVTVRDSFVGAGALTLGVPNVLITVRVGYAEKTQLGPNMMGAAAQPAVMYDLTANSWGTHIAFDWNVSNILLETYLKDQSAGGTVIHWIAPGNIYFQHAYYDGAHKSARQNLVFQELGHEQYADQVFWGLLANDPAEPSVAMASPAVAGNVTDRGHRYAVAYVITGVEQAKGTVSGLVFVIDHTVNGKVQLTNIAISSDAGCTARKIYRTKADGSDFFLLDTIADNVTTTYLDNTADGSLGAQYSMLDGAGKLKPTAGTSAGGAISHGMVRVFGGRNVVFGNGSSDGSKVQFNDAIHVLAGSYYTGDLLLARVTAAAAGPWIQAQNGDATEFYHVFSLPANNRIIIGSESVPANGTDTRILQFNYNGLNKGQLDVNGWNFLDKFACNSATPQAGASIGAALAAYGAGANGLSSGAEMQALVNQVKAMAAALKANGICIV